ncbi:MbtH family NRPS accessory protein [Streptomyces sp. NPDC096339]
MFQVLVDQEGKHAVWSMDWLIRPGWTAVGKSGAKE